MIDKSLDGLARGSRKQVGAVPVRRAVDGTLEVLLVTGRQTGRWVIPKGWPSKRLDDRAAAAREAHEEAGVSGVISSEPIGSYLYTKPRSWGRRPINVRVFLLLEVEESEIWPERHERIRAWFSTSIAAMIVHEPSLAALLKGLGDCEGDPMPYLSMSEAPSSDMTYRLEQSPA